MKANKVVPVVALALIGAHVNSQELAALQTEKFSPTPGAAYPTIAPIVIKGTKVDILEGANGNGDIFACEGSDQTCCTIVLVPGKSCAQVYENGKVAKVFDISSYKTQNLPNGATEVRLIDAVPRK